MPLRCISWIAVSSQPQTEKESPHEQRTANAATVAQLGGTLTAELEVPGQSRDIISFERACAEIHAYAQLRELLERRGADLLVCRDLSRLGRTQALIAQVVAYCQEAGVALYPRNAPPSTLSAAEQSASDSNVLMTAINASFAEIELNTLRRRYQYGMKGRVERGHFYARIPYGYTRAHDERGRMHYAVDSVAAAVIRHALVELYLHRGLSLDAIAAVLNEQGHRAPEGSQWVRNSVKALLERVERYAGWTTAAMRSGSVRAKGSFDPILTDAEVDAIQAERRSRGNGGRSSWRRYLFSQAIVCAACGSFYAGTTHWKYAHLRYYRCPRCRDGQIAEREFVAELGRAVAFAQDGDNLLDILAQTPDQVKRIRADLAAVEEQLESIVRQRRRLTLAYTSETIDDAEYRQLMVEQNERRAAVEKRQSELRQALVAAKDEAQRSDRIGELAAQGRAAVAAMQGTTLGEEEIKAHNAWLRRLLRFTAGDRRILQVEFL